MYDYTQNYSSSLAQKCSDPFQGLAYLGLSRNKNPLFLIPQGLISDPNSKTLPILKPGTKQAGRKVDVG